jgi:hypothetical protein
VVADFNSLGEKKSNSEKKVMFAPGGNLKKSEAERVPCLDRNRFAEHCPCYLLQMHSSEQVT